MKVLSYGAGLQSTDLLERSLSGEFPRLDAVIFADTGAEPEGVYKTALLMEGKCKEAGIEFHRVSAGNILTDTLGLTMPFTRKGHGGFASMPVHLITDKGKGMLRRQCTNEYKLIPIRKKIRELGATAKNPAEMWIGITWDENQRIKDSSVKYIVNVYPFCKWYRADKGWQADTVPVYRHDCENAFKARRQDVPQKSSCFFCPFRDKALWKETMANKETREQSIRLDDAIRHLPRINGEAFLHPSLIPLRVINFNDESLQNEFDFNSECEGLCGV